MNYTPPNRRLLLIGWDAADWKVISPLVDRGLMPHLSGLIERGVMGNMATIEPVLSPMLWTSIATGKRAYKHGIHGFTEPDPTSGAVRPITNLSRTSKALWNILNQQGKRSIVVGWWPSNPAEPIRGAMVSDRFQQAVAPLDKPWPMSPGTVHPPALGKELAPLRVHPYELDGDLLRLFVPNAPEIDQQKDKRLINIAKIIAECAGVQAAATHLMVQQPDWDLTAVYFDGIDHFGHGFMSYHPPRLDWVDKDDYALYSNVVNAGYIFHDMMLGRLIELAGPETTVMLVSDHGFHPDHLRPKAVPNEPAGPAAEHRAFGIFAACGPGIQQDALVYGASLLDVTPTALSLFDLPVGRDMDGRVLTDIFEILPETAYVDSWDSIPGEDGRHPPDTCVDAVDASEAIRQLVDLGYIDEPDADISTAVDETLRELRYNLARAYADGNCLDEAVELFDALWEQWPDESRFGVHLIHCTLDSRDAGTARALMERLKTTKTEATKRAADEVEVLLEKLWVEHPAEAAVADDSEPADQKQIDWDAVDENIKRKLLRLRRRAATNHHAFAYLEGRVLQLEGRHSEALAMLGTAVEAQTNNLPSLHMAMGDTCMAMRDWQRADAHYARVIALDELNIYARYGLALAAYRQGDAKRTASEALTAAGQCYNFPQAHYLAGMALWHEGQLDDALRSLKNALAINPVYPAAHRALARFYLRARPDPSAHLCHLQLAREARWHIAEQRTIGTLPTLHPQEVRDTFATAPADENVQDPAEAPALPSLAETVVVVTGLPRTGTSMMMQLLAAGGVPVLTDDHRPADAGNTRGYFEHQAAKGLRKDNAWLAQTQGQAVKLVAHLIPHLPPEQRYRIIMMHRPLDEVVASQRKLLNRLEKAGGRASDETLNRTFARQMGQIRRLLLILRKRGILDILDIQYHDALADPAGVATRIAAFLGSDTFDVGAAANAIDPALRHEVADAGSMA